MHTNKLTVLAALLISAPVLSGCGADEGDTSTSPSGPLDPPLPGEGVQFRMNSTIAPGTETERCKLFVAPPEGLYVQRDEVRFSPGSHHVILYRTPYTGIPAETRGGAPIDAAVEHDCSDGASSLWKVNGLVGGSQSFQGDSLLGELPEGVAIHVEPGTVLMMNTHYLNASPEPLEADARINLFTIPPEQVREQAGMLFYYNAFIRVPANGSSSARMRCTLDQDISLVRVQSHMHRRGVGFTANLVRGDDGDNGADGDAVEEIYATTAWEQVPARQFEPALQIKAGQSLDYRCDYANTESRDIAQGITTRDEMCMLVGPYYPRSEHIENCEDERGFPAETWVGGGAATCAETIDCVARAGSSGEDGASAVFGCVVDSCPGAAREVSAFMRCQMTDGYGACAAACSAGGDGCSTCMAGACAADVAACSAASCDRNLSW